MVAEYLPACVGELPLKLLNNIVYVTSIPSPAFSFTIVADLRPSRYIGIFVQAISLLLLFENPSLTL
ncbi:MAG: hypothetical protein DRO18_00425 [Thermoprotei archaeon]|nr:MAG: hypothetical protein DRO18_00425 [Thermoprotei archaeon]